MQARIAERKFRTFNIIGRLVFGAFVSMAVLPFGQHRAYFAS